jgi:hypothetical protein
VPQVILKVFIIMLYKNVFQNPELFPTQVSLYPEHSTLTVSHMNMEGFVIITLNVPPFFAIIGPPLLFEASQCIVSRKTLWKQTRLRGGQDCTLTTQENSNLNVTVSFLS